MFKCVVVELIRPEIRDGIWRFREVIIGVGVSIVGINWAINSTGILQIIGTSLSLAGALLVFAGIQRTRFRIGSGGRGLVQVIEGQVTYYGPEEGGSIAIDDLVRVDLVNGGDTGETWVLHSADDHILSIPVRAEGAEHLFDVFNSLDGIETGRMLTQLEKPTEHAVVIWQAGHAAAH